MNNQLKASTRRFEDLTIYGVYYGIACLALFFLKFLLFEGILTGPNGIHADMTKIMLFPPACAILVSMLVRFFKYVDKGMSVGDIGRTNREAKIHSYMDKFKYLMAFVFLIATYQTAKMNFFGLDIYSFAPEIKFWFNDSYSINAYNSARMVFMSRDLDAYFTVLYSFAAAYFVIGAAVYYGLKVHADLIHKAFYYKSIRLAH